MNYSSNKYNKLKGTLLIEGTQVRRAKRYVRKEAIDAKEGTGR